STRLSGPEKARQVPAVPSAPAVITVAPSGLETALHTTALCPSKTPTCLPVSTFHKRAVLSAEEVTTCRPSRLNAALQIDPVCPLRMTDCLPVSTFHTRAVLSAEAVTTC